MVFHFSSEKGIMMVIMNEEQVREHLIIHYLIHGVYPQSSFHGLMKHSYIIDNT